MADVTATVRIGRNEMTLGVDDALTLDIGDQQVLGITITTDGQFVTVGHWPSGDDWYEVARFRVQEAPPEVVTPPSPPGAILRMDAVVELVQAAGHPAYVEQTGGGCATIYAGEPFDVCSDPRHDKPCPGPCSACKEECDPKHLDRRYRCLAGPGWFVGPNWTDARGAVDDFHIGPDDDGVTEPWALHERLTIRVEPERTAADLIIGYLGGARPIQP